MTPAQDNNPADLRWIERLAAIPYTGAITDILDEMGFHRQVLPHAIQSLVPGQTVAGRALTLRGEPCAVDDPDIVYPPFLKMLGEIRPGRMIDEMDLGESTKARLLHGSALEWLGLKLEDFL